MSKELKRDKNGRFAKKGLPADGGMSQEEYIKHLEWERDTFKSAAEKVSSMYLNKCVDYKALERKHRFAIDAIVLACVQIGWLTRKLSWWTRRKHHDEILDMQMELDTVVWKAKYADAK